MTIPIQPGPFAFLGDVGEGLGAIGLRKDEVNRQREEMRRQQLEEARRQAQTFITLRAAGLMKPKDFDSPENQAVFHAAGYGAVSSEETPDEILRGQTGNFIKQLISGQTPTAPDELRAMMGVPQRGLTQGVNTKIAQDVAAEGTAKVQGAEAQAQLPGAALSGRTVQLGAQEKMFNSLADRYIEGLYATTKKLPASGADAFAAALADPNAAPLAQAMGQSYFDQAIERQRAKLTEEATKRAAAQTRAAGAGGTLTDDAMRALTAQQTRASDQLRSVTTQLDALKRPDPLDVVQAQGIERAKTRGRPPSPGALAAKERIDQYNAERAKLTARSDSLNTELNSLRDQMGGVLAPMLGTPVPGARSQPGKQQAAAEYEQRTKGVTDPARRKAIAAEIAKKYGIQTGGAR